MYPSLQLPQLATTIQQALQQAVSAPDQKQQNHDSLSDLPPLQPECFDTTTEQWNQCTPQESGNDNFRIEDVIEQHLNPAWTE